MRCKPPDNRFYADLQDLNAGFLALIADPELPWHGPLLGLDPGVIAGIRGLGPEQLEFVASTPGPLVGFDRFPSPDRIAESRPEPAADDYPADPRWLESARLFSTELMVYSWQTARQDTLSAAICFGPGAEQRSRLANMSFREIQECARPALYQLTARFGLHGRFWPDLLRAAASADPDLKFLSRLAIFPLTLAEGRTAGRY
jgi:hypothetical protein